MIYVSADNGTSGSLSVIYEDNSSEFIETPIKKEQSYTKKKQDITRIDYDKFYEFIGRFKPDDVIFTMERPCVNPGRFSTTLSAIRALESMTIALEHAKIKYDVIDSKNWQHILIPEIKGSDKLKKASKELGLKLFPEHTETINKHNDADALLIGYWVKNYKNKF